MAKTGFWLKGANGKLAGATIYKQNGETVMREVVTTSNPKTTPQLIQRIIMHTVMVAYSLKSQDGHQIVKMIRQHYAKRVSEISGFSSRHRFDWLNINEMTALFQAMCKVENGVGIDVSVIKEGYYLAFGGDPKL